MALQKQQHIPLGIIQSVALHHHCKTLYAPGQRELWTGGSFPPLPPLGGAAWPRAPVPMHYHHLYDGAGTLCGPGWMRANLDCSLQIVATCGVSRIANLKLIHGMWFMQFFILAC